MCSRDINVQPLVCRYEQDATVPRSGRDAAATTGDSPVIADPEAHALNRTFAVNAFVRFAPIRLVMVQGASPSDCTFTLGPDVPRSFLINPKSGAVLGSVGTHSFSMSVLARDTRGRTADVTSFAMKVSLRDTDVAEFGPNERSCGPGKAVDTAEFEFDKQFTCDCSDTKYGGDNCDLAVAVADEGDTGDEGTLQAVAGVLVAVALIAALTLVVFKYRQYRTSMVAFDFETALQCMVSRGLIDPLTSQDLQIPREIKRGDVNIVHKIGEGQFGEVWIGKLDEKQVPAYLCAVKVEKVDAQGAVPESDSLESEASLMAQVPEHPNLVSLIGVVTSGSPTLMLVSYCENGSLLK